MDQKAMIDDLVRMLDAGAAKPCRTAKKYRPWGARTAQPHRWRAAFPPSMRALTGPKTNKPLNKRKEYKLWKQTAHR